MESRYKIIISNKTLYKEIELAADAAEVRVGTSAGCDVRLRKELFFGSIELVFKKNGHEWSVICSDNLYITVGDVRKLATKQLKHGDMLEVRYQESENVVLSIEFLFDFDDGKRKYERAINVSNCGSFTIGTSRNCNIVLQSNYVKNDYIEFAKQNDAIAAHVQDSTYGLYHNGQKATANAKICNGDFFSISDYFFYYKNGQLWTEIRADLVISGLNFMDSPTVNNYPKFNRNTRINSVVDDEKIEILDPPAKPQKPKNNLI